MRPQNELYQLVYDFYVTRILFGYYRFGDILPAISKINAYFHLSVPTVRAALRFLEKDGYIKIAAPKPAQVTYKASENDFLRNISAYLSARKDGLEDMKQVTSLLLGPLLTAGIKQRDDAAWRTHWQEIKDIDFNGMSLTIQLYIFAISSLNNNLISNFYWEINRYARIPYLRGQSKILKEVTEQMELLPKDEIVNYLTNELRTVYESANDRLLHVIQTVNPEILNNDVAQIPFEWNFYHKRSQIRYKLGTRIIQEILHDQYPIGSYLPSLPQMSDHYHVPLITIRRTIDFLTEFGVVKSHQGKGIQVCLGQENVDMSQANVQLALNCFLESLQFLALTIRSVSRFTFEGVSDRAFHELIQILERIHEKAMDHLVMDVFLVFLTEHCTSSAVCHCYQKLIKCLAVGYPFTLFRIKDNEFSQTYAAMVLRMITSIESRDTEGLAEQIGIFFEEQEQYFKTFILHTKIQNV